MLYTVSAVQILATIDAFDELETRGSGKASVGKCELLKRLAICVYEGL
jgi:hypothetical protein